MNAIVISEIKRFLLSTYTLLVTSRYLRLVKLSLAFVPIESYALSQFR
jgi:hypothetical protein